MITAIIVDDEENNRVVLSTILNKHCPQIKVIGEAESADAAFLEITRLKPALVFLDIRMPQKSGFDLLKMFQEIPFEVIMVTAFDNYAMSAFEFNAIDYILKPINYQRLVMAVEKVSKRIEANNSDNLVLHFVKTLSDENELINKFSVHHNGKVVFVNISDISFIEVKDNNTILNLFDNRHYYTSKDLAKYESLLGENNNFIRINKSTMLNINAIKNYSKGEPCIIEVKTGQCFDVSRRRKSEILKRLKSI